MRKGIDWLLRIIGVLIVVRMTTEYGVAATVLMFVYGICFLLFVTSEMIEDWWRAR